MKKNESKKITLQAIEELEGPVEVGVLSSWLRCEYGVDVTDRSVSMECLRLHRQGLLHRRHGKYFISEKGSQRLQYLRSLPQ